LRFWGVTLSRFPDGKPNDNDVVAAFE